MKTIYIYLLDTMADWEIGHVTAELHSKRFFRKNATDITLKTVSLTKEPIQTMGGLTLLPDLTLEEMSIDSNNVLILPGADTWHDPKHQAILEKAEAFLSADAYVCAICGATVALANKGLLNNIKHTSNGVGFLDMMCPSYQGKELYVDMPAVTDGHLITAACTGSLEWAKEILTALDVFRADTMTAWFSYFKTGDANAFFALMQSLQAE